MKLFDYDDYSGTPVPGFSFDILKFKRRSVIIITVDQAMTSNKIPSLMVSIGPLSLFELSIGLVKYYLNISIWDKHYDY